MNKQLLKELNEILPGNWIGEPLANIYMKDSKGLWNFKCFVSGWKAQLKTKRMSCSTDLYPTPQEALRVLLAELKGLKFMKQWEVWYKLEDGWIRTTSLTLAGLTREERGVVRG